MKLTAIQIENKVSELNQWLQINTIHHKDYKLKKHSRDYYVSKLTEMDNFSLKKIEV